MVKVKLTPAQGMMLGDDDNWADPEYRRVLWITACFLGVAMVFVILGVLAAIPDPSFAVGSEAGQ